MLEKATVLVVDDDQDLRDLLEEGLREAGHEVLTAAAGDEALERVIAGGVDVVVTDVVMPGLKGEQLLAEIHAWAPDLPVILITGFGTIEAAVSNVKAGAYHYLAKPFKIEELVALVGQAIRDGRVRGEMAALQAKAGGIAMVADSLAMCQAVAVAVRAARADTPVLVVGESGTGKELLARLIHAESPRKTERFVPVNCSAIPETLIESVLFGHRRGSFTDAREDRQGLFQEAHKGTIFLDEIGDLPFSVQGKLLRTLQEGEVQPIGAPAPIPVDARVVAATHRDLPGMIKEGRFRDDLFYRINVISIAVPPLRDRPEDLLPLTAHFLEKHGRRLGLEGNTVTPRALEALRRYGWPGNVRELENVIERALVLGTGAVIDTADLPPDLARSTAPSARAFTPRPLEDVEREHILRTLRATNGNKAAAARILGLDRKTLYRKLDEYGIK